MSLPPALQELANQLNKQKQDLQQAVGERQRLETQLQESKIVKLEFDQLEDDAKIFKMIGPVLVPQDKIEADSNVGKRMDFIQKQITSVEDRIKTLQTSLQEKQAELQLKAQELQQQMQQQQQSASA